MNKQNSGWMPQLDGLRGISILMVLAAHVYAPGWHDLQGSYGVTVFFVLSGFLITRLLLREESDTGGIDLAAFYIRRAFRLFPIYYLILGVYCILILGVGLHSDGRSGFVEALPWYLVYLQDIPYFRDRSHIGGQIAMPFMQSWSLGIEEKFYLVWPVVAFRFLRFRNGKIILAVGAVLFFSAARFVPLGRYIYPYAAISWGCLFALLDDSLAIRKTFDGWMSSWGAPLAILSWPLAHFLVAYKAIPEVVQRSAELLYPVSIAFVILASLRVASVAKVLSCHPLVVLGRYSYCMYLIHLLARQSVEMVLRRFGMGVGNGLLVYFLMLLSSVAGASFLYYTVESKFREMGRRIAHSWSQRGKESTAPPAPTLGDRALGVD